MTKKEKERQTEKQRLQYGKTLKVNTVKYKNYNLYFMFFFVWKFSVLLSGELLGQTGNIKQVYREALLPKININITWLRWSEFPPSPPSSVSCSGPGAPDSCGSTSRNQTVSIQLVRTKFYYIFCQGSYGYCTS